MTPGSNSYCSAVCCTYTQKQVILTKDHEPLAECTWRRSKHAGSARLAAAAPGWAKDKMADDSLPQTYTAFAVIMGNIATGERSTITINITNSQIMVTLSFI